MSSIFLVQFAGIFFAALGLSMAVNKKMMTDVYTSMAKNTASAYAMAIVLLAIGLYFVLNKSVLSELGRFTQLLLKVLGYAMIADSSVHLFTKPKTYKKISRSIIKNTWIYPILTVLLFASGIYLIIMGFTPLAATWTI